MEETSNATENRELTTCNWFLLSGFWLFGFWLFGFWLSGFWFLGSSS